MLNLPESSPKGVQAIWIKYDKAYACLESYIESNGTGFVWLMCARTDDWCCIYKMIEEFLASAKIKIIVNKKGKLFGAALSASIPTRNFKFSSIDDAKADGIRQAFRRFQQVY